MLLILSGVSTLASAFKLIVLLIVFFALLYGAHLFTKWYAKSNYASAKSANVSLIESKQIAVHLDCLGVIVGHHLLESHDVLGRVVGVGKDG